MCYFPRSNDPYLNRFIQPDSIVPNPADPQSWNRYAYVGNNPISYTDPSGHCATGLVVDTVICATLLATLTVAVTAYIYSTPQMQEIGQNAAQYWEATARDWKKGSIDIQNKNREKLINQSGQEHPENANQPRRLKSCKESRTCLGLWGIAITAGVAFVYDLVTTGGNGEDGSNSRIILPTNTPSLIPTNTPTPTRTPTSTPSFNASLNFWERRLHKKGLLE